MTLIPNPPIDILRFATIDAAKTVGAQDHLGTLEAGKLTDLILLDATPLDDKNTQKIWRVFEGGRMFDPKLLRPEAIEPGAALPGAIYFVHSLRNLLTAYVRRSTIRSPRKRPKVNRGMSASPAEVEVRFSSLA